MKAPHLPAPYFLTKESSPTPQHEISWRCPFGQNAGSHKREMSLLIHTNGKSDPPPFGYCYGGDVALRHRKVVSNEEVMINYR
jgi:hypothetical protein